MAKIEIYSSLLKQAKTLSNIKTDVLVVEQALKLFIQIENEKNLISLWGTIEMER